MITTRLYLYDSDREYVLVTEDGITRRVDNGYRGQDLSAYVLSGVQNTENLTEELDVTELTLQGYPIREEFAPETKFIIDVYEGDTLMYTYHRIVQEDVVDQPILSKDGYFTHTITLIEPSAIAQKRIVDNMAVTYKLKDVNLETRAAFDIGKWAKTSVNNNIPYPSRGFACYEDVTSGGSTLNDSFGKYFRWYRFPAVFSNTQTDITVRYRAKNKVSGILQLVEDVPYQTALYDYIVNIEGRAPEVGDLVISLDPYGIYRKNFCLGVYNGVTLWHSYVATSTDWIDNDYIECPFEYVCTSGIKKDENNKTNLSFVLPVPYIMWGRTDYSHRPPQFKNPAYQEIGIASFDCIITKKDLAGRTVSTQQIPFISNSNLGRAVDPQTGNIVSTTFPYLSFDNEGDYIIKEYKNGYNKSKFEWEYLIEKMDIIGHSNPLSIPSFWSEQNFYFSKYTDSVNGRDLSGHVETPQIEIDEDFVYTIQLSVKNMAVGDVPVSFNNDGNRRIRRVYPYTSGSLVSFYYGKDKKGWWKPYAENVETNYINNRQKTIDCSFQAYNISGISKLITSGMEYSALGLITRAIAGTGTFFKEAGISSSDLNNNKFPFYISDDGGENIIGGSTLLQTRINEAFYHQKNLWEVLLEAGKYVHSIPQVTFGSDDRLAISFYKLGGTNQLTSGNARISVMNFRKIDDYLSACSSYVDNLVQLGGRMVEIVAPKSSSEDYLVDNNTAEIIVTKPILEILKVDAIVANDFHLDYGGSTYNFTAGTSRDITEYIYEQSVYNILSIQYNEIPNKGLALYYDLGDNKIVGGDYQLPSKVTNAYSDFSFKKVLFSAFHGYITDYPVEPQPQTNASGAWVDLKVNDFIFRVEYRTKDTARVEHTRPDLRHYILTSKYDKVPSHKQFNNQQDILVDSVAFGGSMFGKLIRTGNSNYKMREWCANIGDIKHKGELYNIDGQWYYVGKVTNIFFPEHIESIVEYSKDYNQLSEIIGIPSEPRFYEISERSSIDREVAINDYFLVTTDENKIDTNEGLISDISHTASLIFKNGGTFLRWANTRFHGDPDMDSADQPTYGVSDFEKFILSPLNAYSIGNTLTYEWDMQDNFSAGDEVGEETEPTGTGSTKDNAYRTMRAVQYCDQYGKSTLFDFYLFGDLQLNPDQVRLLPNSTIVTPRAVIFHGKHTPYTSDWLYYSQQSPITPQDATVYEVVGFIQGTIDAVESLSSAPNLSTLDGIILQQTGRQAQEGDTLIITISTNGVEKYQRWYKREASQYIYYTLWGYDLGEWNNGNFFVTTMGDGEQGRYFAIDTDSVQKDYIVSNREVNKSIILLKDCRETLHFNYNLMQITDSDKFVLSPFFFTEGRRDDNNMQGVKIVILMEEVNKMSNGYISTNTILYENTNPSITATGKMITVDMSWINSLSDDIKAAAKSIVIMEKNQLTGSSQQFIIAKNGDVSADNWYFGAPNKDNLFTRRQ